VGVHRTPSGGNVIRVTLPVTDPAALIRAFLSREGASGRAETPVTALVMRADSELLDVSRTLKGVLRCSTRGADLLIPVDFRTWLVLLRGAKQTAKKVRSRANRLFTTFRPVETGDGTRPIRCRILESGDAERDREVLERACVEWLKVVGCLMNERCNG
jgi:hypothetical protein